MRDFLESVAVTRHNFKDNVDFNYDAIEDYSRSRGDLLNSFTVLLILWEMLL